VTKDNAMNMDLFEKEIKILRSLRHPNIVLFMGVAITEESRFIITELMLGKSLDALIHGGTIKIDSDYSLHNRISFEKKVELLNDVVKGMIYLHGLEPTIVHRDLKPSVCLRL
jgi:serine/threonine protein kinase